MQIPSRRVGQALLFLLLTSSMSVLVVIGAGAGEVRLNQYWSQELYRNTLAVLQADAWLAALQGLLVGLVIVLLAASYRW